MELQLRVEPEWKRQQHLVHIDDGLWGPMFDTDGNVIEGIVGKIGVHTTDEHGVESGGDFVKMSPGSEFPPHRHEGWHEIFFISGEGFVHIEHREGTEDVPVRAGHLIHIPGECVHNVRVDKLAREPLVFMAVGHPHKHVHASDRMLDP